MPTTIDPRSVIVVGGGIAGLTAAAFAARAGHRVTLFERAAAVGGRAATSNHAGFQFNRGPHAMYLGQAGEAALRELDVPYPGARAVVSDGSAIRNGRRYLFPASVRSVMTTRLFGVRGRLEVGRLLADLPRLDTSSLDHTTIGEWLDATFHDAAARDFIESLFRVSSYQNVRETGSAGAALHQLRSALAGVLYIDGGWQTLVDGLRDAALSEGVTIESATRVERLEGAAGIDSVLLASGRRLHADAVILATPPAEAASLCTGPAAEVLQGWRRELLPVQAACLNLGLSRLPNPRRQYALGTDRPTYFSVHSRSAKLAPKGGAMIHAAIYLPVGEPVAAATNLAELEALVDLMQPGWRDVLVAREYLPNMNVTNAAVLARSGGLTGRPGPDIPGVANLFVAGDWVGPECMLADAAYASARAAAELASAAASRSATIEAAAAR